MFPLINPIVPELFKSPNKLFIPPLLFIERPLKPAVDDPKELIKIPVPEIFCGLFI